MKLLRWGEAGAERPGMLDAGGVLRDLTGLVPDIGGPVLSDAGLAMLRTLNPATLPAVPAGARIGPCVAGVGKYICIGLNYADHAAESGMTVPPEPVIFLKANSCICGPDDPILMPRGSDKLDWEIELAIVIGAKGKHIPLEQAMSHVAGYALANDVSERSFQLERSGQWTKGKSCDNFGPIGPWLVTRDEVPDPQDLPMWLTVNGQTMQQGSTRTMVYGVAFLVSYLSQFFTLHPGDVIATGTPPGVGMGRKPPHYLREGDVVELAIEGLGKQRQLVVAED